MVESRQIAKYNEESEYLYEIKTFQKKIEKKLIIKYEAIEEEVHHLCRKFKDDIPKIGPEKL